MQGTLTPSHPLGPHPARRGVPPALILVLNRRKFRAGGAHRGAPHLVQLRFTPGAAGAPREPPVRGAGSLSALGAGSTPLC